MGRTFFVGKPSAIPSVKMMRCAVNYRNEIELKIS